jgi:hypothetical protein
MKVCSICNHSNRSAIDKAMVDGQSLRVIAGQTGTAKSALDRHKKHLAPALVVAKQAERVSESTGLLSRIERLMSRLELICQAATMERDWLPAIAASRELRGCLELLGKLNGELKTAGGTRVKIAIGSEQWKEGFRNYLDMVVEGDYGDTDSDEAEGA